MHGTAVHLGRDGKVEAEDVRRPRRAEEVADGGRAECEGVEERAGGADEGAGRGCDGESDGGAGVGRPKVAAQVLVHATGRDVTLRVEVFPACR